LRGWGTRGDGGAGEEGRERERGAAHIEENGETFMDNNGESSPEKTKFAGVKKKIAD
jgi:hypothetical protein